MARHDPSMVVSLKPRSIPQSHLAVQAPQAPAAAAPRIEHIARVPSKKRRRMPAFVFLIVGAIGIAVGSGIYFTSKGIAASGAIAQATNQQNVDQLVASVGKLMLLPQSEEPTVATVSDLEALKGQAFFENAAIGDKVLMYPKAGEAVLYDPSADKVIQVGPLTVGGK